MALRTAPQVCCAAAAAGLLLSAGTPAAADVVPGLLVPGVTIAPDSPYHVSVRMGQAKFFRFSCFAGPADAVISLSTYSLHSDPLVLVSLDPDDAPTFKRHDASSFALWREGAGDGHHVIARAMGPRGGIVGIFNTRHFATEDLDGVLSIRCKAILAFDFLFWDHLRDSEVLGLEQRRNHEESFRGHQGNILGNYSYSLKRN
ncbi:hypothetical protein N9L68_03830 [bacterium]|nr:hypothetical protein [bacterium]